MRTRLHAIALAAGLLLAGAPADAAQRWWTYIGGCASADWLGMPAGSTNAQGATTCWAASGLGPSGQSAPGAADDVYLRSTGSGDFSVNFANPARPAFIGRARTLDIRGTDGGLAGLSLAATLPATTTLEVGELKLGLGGRGQLQQAGGRVVVQGNVLVGQAINNVGRYTLSGGTLEVGLELVLGQFGEAEFTQTGGQATLGRLLMAGARGGRALAQVSGGTLRADVVEVGSTGDAATLAVSGNGQVVAGRLTLGNGGASSRGAASVSGAGARLDVTGPAFRIGNEGTGILTVGDGGQLTSRDATLGWLAGARGEALVAGGGARWTLSGDLSVGTGLLTVGSGGTVQAPALAVNASGRVVLHGGELAVGSAGGSGSFEWRSGTLRLGAPGGTTALGSFVLPNVTALAPQQSLIVHGMLAVGSGLLALNGGTLQADTLTLTGGTLAVVDGGTFDVATVGSLSGHGSVLGAVRGGPASSVVASGGVLTMGNANRPDGFDFDGILTVAGTQLVLLDSDGARLGQGTLLADGGRLASANGLLLDTGRMLQFSSSTGIEGAFTHRGTVKQVSGQGSDTLTFFDDVTGPGSFAGNIVFRGLYTPGGAAAVGFGGGTLRVDTSGALVLDIGGLGAGSFARLAGIRTLDFAGALQLVFAPGLALPAEGATLDLLDFDGFAGGFAPARIGITGLAAGDLARLDFSQLAVDGTLRIAPVPEPAAAWLLLAGLAGLALRARPVRRVPIPRVRRLA